MDPQGRSQIRLILDHLTEQSVGEFEALLKEITQRNAAKGCLKSAATIREALRKLESVAGSFITKTVDQVSAVSLESEAFALILDAFTCLTRELRSQYEGLVAVATDHEAPHSSATVASQMELLTTELRVKRQLEIHRFSFTKFSTILQPSQPDSPPRPPTNRGGKPLGAHWDEMWASIAVRLYVGDLQPKSQADIERAVKDWFAERDISVGDTAARQRARQLWGKLQSAD